MSAGTRLPAVTASRGARERGVLAALAPALGHGREVAVAALVTLAALAWWLEPAGAVVLGVLAAALAGTGLLLAGAGRIEAPSVLSGAVLALVLGASVLCLALLALALAGAPMSPEVVVLLGFCIAVAAAVAGRRRRDASRTPAGDVPLLECVPSRAVLVMCGGICATVMLVLPSLLHQVALALYMAAIAGVLLSGREATETAADRGRERGDGASRAWQARARATVGALAPWVPAGLLGVLLVTRLVPFLRSPVPLGYDTGLYLAVQRDFAAALPSLPAFAPDSWADVQPPGLYLLSNLLHLAGAPAEATLWGLLITTQLIAAVGVWLLGRDLGGRGVATWALALFVLSSAQFVMYYEVYFKQALSMALFPFALWLWRRESWLAIPVGAFIAATHTMAFLLLGLVLLADAAWPEHPRSLLRRPRLAALHGVLIARSYRLVAGAGILVVGLTSYLAAPGALTEVVSPDVRGTLATLGIGASTGLGSFPLARGDYALLVLPLIPFAALTLVQGWREPRLRLVVLWAGWSLAFVALDLIFGRRFIASFDPALILLAAVSLGQLTSRARTASVMPFAVVALMVSAFLLARTVHDLGPAIAADDVADLRATSAGLPDGAYLMAVSATDTPWVRGYGGRDTIAPGFLEHDRWSRAEWGVFWAPPNPEDRYALLGQYDRPIYLFMRGDSPMPSIAADPRFERISRTVWVFLEPAGAPGTAPGTRAPPANQ